MSKFNTQALRYAAVATLAAAAGAANAAAVDVEAIVTDIGAQVGPIGQIGAAILLVVVGIAAFKWVRRAIN